MGGEVGSGFDRQIFPDGGKDPRGTRPKRRISVQVQLLIFAIVLIAVIGTVGYAYLRPKDQSYLLDTYQYITVGTRDFRDSVYADGTVVPEEISIIGSPATARVIGVKVAPGDDVEEGQVLAVLSSSELDDDLQAAREELQLARLELDQAQLKSQQDLETSDHLVSEAQVELDAAKQELPVVEKLFQLGGTSKFELDGAHKRVESAQKALVKARQSLEMTRQQGELTVQKANNAVEAVEKKMEELTKLTSDLTVIAKKPGKVLALRVKVGQEIGSGDEVLQLCDVKKQYIETYVSTSNASRISEGQRVLVRSGGTFYANVSTVSPQAITVEQSTVVPVRISLNAEAASTLRPNEPVACEIETGVRKERPYVPRGPFFTSGDGAFVYVITEPNQAVRTDIKYGALDGNAVEIQSGLEPGDRIIYSSYSAFRSFPEIRLAPEGGRKVE